MNKMIFFGIDPGKTGAIGWICADIVSGKVLDYGLDDLKLCKASENSKKKEVDPNELRSTIAWACNMCALPTHSAFVTLEHVWARPSGKGGNQDAGIVSAASITNSMTCCKTVVKMMNLRFELVVPQKWKKHFNLSSDKEEARLFAIGKFPEMENLLKYKKNADRAEALLMALYGLENYRVEERG